MLALASFPIPRVVGGEPLRPEHPAKAAGDALSCQYSTVHRALQTDTVDLRVRLDPLRVPVAILVASVMSKNLVIKVVLGHFPSPVVLGEVFALGVYPS